MTVPPSPPNRPRRWIVVTVAVLVLGVCWWIWPRGDRRFLGKWSAFEVSDSRGKYFGEFEFGGDRTLKVVYANREESRTTWRVEQDRLILGLEVPGVFESAARHAIAGLRYFSGSKNWGAKDSWSIVSVGKDEIQVQRPEEGSALIILRRME